MLAGKNIFHLEGQTAPRAARSASEGPAQRQRTASELPAEVPSEMPTKRQRAANEAAAGGFLQAAGRNDSDILWPTT